MTIIAVWLLGLPPWPADAAEYRWTVQPVLSADVEYTDNLFLENDDPEEDLVKVYSPGVILEARSRTSQFRFLYNFGITRYSRFDEFNTIRHSMDVNARVGFTRRTIFDFAHQSRITEEPVEDLEGFDADLAEDEEPEPVDVQQLTVRQSRERYLTQNNRFSLTHQFNRSDLVRFTYNLYLLRNESPEIRNENRYNPLLELIYWPIPGRLEFQGDVGYTRDDVESSDIEPGFLDEEVYPSARLNYWVIPQKLRVSAGLEYRYGVTNDEAAPADILIRDDDRYESLKPIFGFSYVMRPQRLNIDGDGYHERGLTYDEDGKTDANDDFRTWYGRLRVTRRVNPRLSVFAQYAHTATRYDGDETNIDYQVFEPSVGVSYLIGDDLPLTLSIGYLGRALDDGLENAITVNGQLGEWRFSRRGSLRFNASSGYDQDNFGTERFGFGVRYNALLTVTYIIAKNLTADFTAQYDRNRYVDNENDPFAEEDVRDDRSLDVGLGINYQPFRWMNIRLAYQYRALDAVEDIDDYQNNRVLFQISMTPPRGIRVR